MSIEYMSNTTKVSVPQLRQMVMSFALWWLWLNPRSCHVGLVDKGTVMAFLLAIGYPLLITIPASVP